MDPEDTLSVNKIPAIWRVWSMASNMGITFRPSNMSNYYKSHSMVGHFAFISRIF
jgi:hypothetical protein